MTRSWPDKDPDDTRRYGMDWQDVLADGDSLLAVEWSATPSGLTLSEAAIDGTEASTLIEGGTAGTTYRVTCRATTAEGEQMDRSLSLFVISR